jgi:thymidylate synthase
MDWNYWDNTLKFYNANDAFTFWYDKILFYGRTEKDTKFLHNIGFYMLVPSDNKITVPWRNWSESYAKREWAWYESKNPDAREMAKYAPLWKTMMDADGHVNSNYGYQWHRNNQLDHVVNLLKKDPGTRRAVITIYDGKEHELHSLDTPCTLTIGFRIVDKRLCMTVNMRSNDLIYGFCNDQYCFSQLQILIAKELGVQIGSYFHFATDLHIYKKHWEMKK